MAKKRIEQHEEIDPIEVTNAVAEEIAAELIAEDEYREHTAEVTAKQEREQLIAEACRLQGRVEGLNVTSKFVTVTTLMMLKQIKENKIYKDMPNIGTWENFCKSIGFSVNKVDEDLKNLEVFGTDFLTTVGTFGIGYRELRQLKRAKTDGTFAIESDSVIIEGEVIQLTDKDELKEALEQLIIDQNRKLKGKDDMVKKYAEQQEIAHKAMKHAEAEQKKAETERDTFKEKLNTIYQGRLGEVAPADREDFQTIANLEIDFNRVLGAAIRFSDKKISEFNAQMMCAVVSKMMVAVDDIRQKLSAEHHYHFDGGILEKTELDRLSEGDTPQSFLLEE